MTDLSWRREPFGALTEAVWGLERAFKDSSAADQAEGNARIRIFFLLALFLTGFLFLAAGATRSALFADLRKSNLYAAPVGVARADLVDRNGQLLAVDLIHYGLYLDPREIWDTAETRRILSATVPGLQAQRLDKALGSDHIDYLIGGLTPDQKAQLQDMGLPGVSFEAEERRVYPLGASGAHAIGFVNKAGEGQSGLERAFDEQIRKQAGGDPLVTSLDLRVQTALQDELEKAAIKFGVNDAVGLVTNIHTGEVLGMASWPAFDPNEPGAGCPDKAKDDCQDNSTNRASSSLYEPGSVFKVFSMAMALDSGSATFKSTYDVQSLTIGRRQIHDFHPVHGSLTLPEVFIHSSNIGTAKMALQAGAPTLTRYFDAFGLFAPARIELPALARPHAPKVWSEAAVAQTSFGQGISVSPLHLAQGMGAILNGGEMIPLTFRKLDRRPQGKRIISQDTSRRMLDLMRLNVTAKEGSGGKADAPGLSVGGKTGTAQLVIDRKYSKDRVLASFAAVFPTDGPLDADRFFVLIMLKDPKRLPETRGFATAGWNAAPAAGRVIDRIAPFVGVRRAALSPAVSPIAASAEPPGEEGSDAIDDGAPQ